VELKALQLVERLLLEFPESRHSFDLLPYFCDLND